MPRTILFSFRHRSMCEGLDLSYAFRRGLMGLLAWSSLLITLSACKSPKPKGDGSPSQREALSQECEAFARYTCDSEESKRTCLSKYGLEITKARLDSGLCSSAMSVVESLSQRSKPGERAGVLRLARELVLQKVDPDEPKFRDALFGRALRQPPAPDGIWYCFEENENPRGETGVERWCERLDGTRSGPALRWGKHGELVFSAEYVDGVPRRISYEMGISYDSASEVLICDCGVEPKRQVTGESVEVDCGRTVLTFAGAELRLAKISSSGTRPEVCPEQ